MKYKWFKFVLETARMIVKQTTPKSTPIPNPPGHFRNLVIFGMNPPSGYMTVEEEELRKSEEALRKQKEKEELEDAKNDQVKPEVLKTLCKHFSETAKKC